MKLKTIEKDGAIFAEVKDGKPVYIGDDGAEIAFDAPGTTATITRLNGEAMGHRRAKEDAEKALKLFEGLDATAAREAIDKLSKIDAKKLVEAGDMDAAIQAAIKPYADKLAAAEKTNGDLSGALNKETIGNRFAMSKFAAEKLTPAGIDLIKTLYGDRLKVDGGQVVGLDAAGNKILSLARPGEVASFDEVIETFVGVYPHKDHILKGQTGAGGGAGDGGSGGAGAKTMKTADFNALEPKARAARMSEGVTLVD